MALYFFVANWGRERERERKREREFILLQSSQLVEKPDKTWPYFLLKRLKSVIKTERDLVVTSIENHQILYLFNIIEIFQRLVSLTESI